MCPNFSGGGKEEDSIQNKSEELVTIIKQTKEVAL
jgi:hypothetical protein